LLLITISSDCSVRSCFCFYFPLSISNVLVFALDVDDVTATSVKVSDFGLTVNAYTATYK